MTVNEALASVRERVAGARAGVPTDEKGLMLFSAERMPVTVPHVEIAVLLQTQAGATLQSLMDQLKAANGTISREYSLAALDVLIERVGGA